MKKHILTGLAMGLLLVGNNGTAQALMTTIGTATYNGSDYKLIWEDSNNGNSLVWLDYTHRDYTPGGGTWNNQMAWAAGLDGALTINLGSGYSITWDDASWRLPATLDGPYSVGYDGTTTAGFNITSSEMGYLYYKELGNIGRYNTSGELQSNFSLQNTGDFNNLFATWYWSGTDNANGPDAWNYSMYYGWQTKNSKSTRIDGALAVRSGQVSAVPVPGTLLLFGTGLAGIGGSRFRRKK